MSHTIARVSASDRDGSTVHWRLCMSDTLDANRNASANAAAPDRARGRDAAGIMQANVSEHCDGKSALDLPAREQVPVSDEVLARRLAEELNTTGRKRRAPEPVFVPAPLWAPGGKGKRAKGPTPKPRSTGRAPRKHTPRARAGCAPDDASEDFRGDDRDGSRARVPSRSESDIGSGSDSDDTDDERPLCDVEWRTRVPEKELAPPPGYASGDLVWARLSSRKRAAASARADPPDRDAGADADDPSVLWWPGRVWKLRNCQHVEQLWRNRGAPPSTPMALVRCFGDGSFAWAGAEALAPFFVPRDWGDRTDGIRVEDAPGGSDGPARGRGVHAPLPSPESPEGREGVATTRVGESAAAAAAIRIRSRHDAFAARLLAMATRRSAPKKREKHGLRVAASVARKALEEAEEACMGAWVPAWSASEGEEESGDEERGDEGTAATDKNGRRKRDGALDVPVDPRHAMRAYEPREDGEKDGLTPDWVIDAGCRVFELDPPTIEAPIVRGLLDPCTNSKRRPNIPAEKTYDKADDGLKQENSWKGFHVILNPSYESSVQWRFINRAINEVEWGFCPGILLVCRNSTDTSYFQRLLPFPRVFLRRDAIMFKDYDHTPIGFGIAVFCLVSPVASKATKLATYRRFFNEFQHAGEFNVPFDEAFMEEAAFEQLTDRLHVAAATRFRDSWVACDKCDRWREIPPTQSLAQIGASATWRCGFAYPSQGCAAPLTDRELKAFSVARKGHALALRAEKHGTDIRNGDLTRTVSDGDVSGSSLDSDREGDPSRRGTLLAAPAANAAAPPRAEASDAEEASEGWRKMEKTEDDTSDAGDQSGDQGGDQSGGEEETTDAVAEEDASRRESTTKKPDGTDPPPDPMDAWLDEVSLRGGRKRFALGEAPVRPRAGARRRAARHAARRDDACAAEDARLTDFERERLANVLRNREKLASMFGTSNTAAADDGAEDPRALAERLERAAAEASSALAVATRALKAADATCAKASAVSEASVARARSAAAAAAVAEKEARVVASEALDARAEALAARAVAERLAALADDAEARCDAAAQAAG